MSIGILISSAIIAGVVVVGKMFKSLVVDRLDRFEDYEEKGWM